MPSKIHTDYPAIDECNAAWVRKYLPFDSDEDRQQFLELRIPMWDCQLFPVGTKEQVLESACITSLILAIDDRPLVRHAFFGGGDPCLVEGHPFSQIFVDLWGKLKCHMKPSVYRRYCYEWQLWFDSVITEGELQENGVVLDFNSFRELRRFNSALLPYFVFAEYLHDLDLSELIHDEDLQLAIQATNDHVMLVNDLYSYRKERSAGVTLNAMESLTHTHQMSLQQAADEICTLISEADQIRETQCQKLRRRYAHRPDAGQLGRYLDTFSTMCSGTLRWILENPRYYDATGRGWNWPRNRRIYLDPELS
ncbi:terpene synthase family protein [Serratia entomophila]|uniref:terpene synthase family protein n=1 Tax=Serratia entomophila TaxID=42906 RepID=UPI0021BA7696|nr:terpene synthase family protein [Serratia entomophila]